MSKNTESTPKSCGPVRCSPCRWIIYPLLLALILLSLVRFEPHVKFAATKWALTQERINGVENKPLKRALGINHKFSPKEFLAHVKSGDINNVFLFLSAGMNPNTMTEDGTPATHLAVNSGDREMVKLLVGQGANVNTHGPRGLSVLALAVTKQDPLMTQTLAGLGANVNEQTGNGRTALMLAIQAENSALSKMLVDMGINVNLVDQDQNSALHYAIKTDNPALVHLVLNAGANINKQNAEGLTAFDLAVKGRNAQLLRVIQAAGGLSGAEFTAPATKEEGKTEKLSDEDWVKKALGIEEPEPEEEPEVQAAEPEEVEPTPIPTPEPTPTPAPTPVRPERPETTQVRALGRPTGVWVRKGGLTLDSVTVRAKNMSHIEAKEVKVKVRLPDGDIVAVTGPTTLGRFETGTYTASVGKEIFSGKKLKAIVTCGNCYK